MVILDPLADMVNAGAVRPEHLIVRAQPFQPAASVLAQGKDKASTCFHVDLSPTCHHNPSSHLRGNMQVRYRTETLAMLAEEEFRINPKAKSSKLVVLKRTDEAFSESKPTIFSWLL